MAGTHGAATVPVMFGYRHSPELAFWVVAVSVVGVVALIEALLGGCAAPGPVRSSRSVPSAPRPAKARERYRPSRRSGAGRNARVVCCYVAGL